MSPSALPICLLVSASWSRRAPPPPASPSPPPNGPPLSIPEKLTYFYHLGQCASCLALLGLLAACALVIPAPSEHNISVSGCAGIWIRNFFSSCSSRMFCPSAGQDAAGVGNAGPNRRHQTERDRKGKHGAVLGDLDHWSPHSSSWVDS